MLSEDEVDGEIIFSRQIEYAKRWRLEHTVEVPFTDAAADYVDVIDASDEKAREILNY